MRNEQAQKGVDRLRAHVDSLIVINNNKLREVYGNLGFKAGFSKADEVLATASRGIAEVITHHYTQNIDLRDAKTVLSNSGTAIMGSATASGTNRAHEAISKALDSPLLNDNKITGAKNVLLLIVSGGDEITIDEIGEINDHIQGEAGNSANIIMGVGEDESLGDAVSVTIIATGFNVEQQDDIVNVESKKIIHTLEEEQKAEHDLMPEAATEIPPVAPIVQEEPPKKIVHTLDLDEDTPELFPSKIKPQSSSSSGTPESDQHTAQQLEMDIIPTTDVIKNMEVVYDEILLEDASEFEIIDTTAPVNQETQHEVSDSSTSEASNMLSFDMPLQSSERSENTEDKQDNVVVESDKAPVLFDLDEDLEKIEVKEPIEIIPVTSISKEGETRYSLEDYMELEDNLTTAKQDADSDDDLGEETIVFETKTVAPQADEDIDDEEVDPMNSPISKLLVDRAAERKRKMKEFNYKFHHNQSRIEDIEKQPAYKRMGIDLEETPDKDGNLSRTTLSTDDNDDIQLRSNNSFLHDNVD